MSALWRLVPVLLVAFSAVASARVEVLEFDTPEHEARYNKLIAELRCLVCQNQNLADSNAELAIDLRRKTYAMVMQDKSVGEIADYMADRYGDFVLYRPPLNSNTLLLWIGPFVILLAGVTMLVRTIRQRRDERTVGVDAARMKDAAALLDQQSEEKNA